MNTQDTFITNRSKHVFLFFVFLFFGIFSFAQTSNWTWMHGDTTGYGPEVTGTMGVAAPANTPNSLYESARWKDANGNLWIFGGVLGGYEYGALWKFDPITNMWAYMNGVPSFNIMGSYGTQGVASPSNHPGSRGWGAASWTDNSGDLWLFGGWGMDASGQIGPLGDLWRYHIATNEWTWMSGSPNAYYNGSYGTIQVPNVSNAPPSRQECIANWVDNNGDLWLYGGNLQSTTNYGDMWRYNIASNTWTWMNGNYSSGPVWGVMQVPSPSNSPGSRGSASSWTDSQGKFWLYGGTMFGNNIEFGDMWRYDPVTNIWTWMAGSSGFNPNCTFTTPNVAGNGVPGSRFEVKSTWKDACDHLWAFGGFTDPSSQVFPWDELWMFDPSTNLFTWVDGLNHWGGSGSFGTSQVPAATNYPAGTGGASTFMDDSGFVWMFGGWILNTTSGGINTLWRYQPVPDSCSIATGIIHSSENNFIAYPNPGQGTVYVQLSDNLKLNGLQIQLYDVTGKCVETKKDFQTNFIELNPKASGMYFIVLSNEQGKILGNTRIIISK